jgi:hypothetical protein
MNDEVVDKVKSVLVTLCVYFAKVPS